MIFYRQAERQNINKMENKEENQVEREDTSSHSKGYNKEDSY